MFIGYFLIRVRTVLNRQMYKINIMLLLVIVPFLNKMLLPCLFFINLVEIIFFAIDYFFFREEKTDKLLYVLERIVTLVMYNVAITVQTEIPLLVLLIVLAVALIAMKSYQMYKEYLKKDIPTIEIDDGKKEAGFGTSDFQDGVLGQTSAVGLLEDDSGIIINDDVRSGATRSAGYSRQVRGDLKDSGSHDGERQPNLVVVKRQKLKPV